MRLNLATIARAVQATLPERFRETVVTSVTTDSRTAAPGSLFVCVPGERVDGHDFAAAAAGRGACAVLAEKALPAFAAGHPEVCVLVADNSVRALGRIAAAWRDRYAGRVVGLTGTAGKTTVKELLASVLSRAGRVAVTSRNHNNQIGMPTCLLEADGTERFWVMEAGISHPGDMDELGGILRPDLGIVLNAGAGHTEGLGDRGVAWYKSRLFTHLAPAGRAIASADYPELVAETLDVCPEALFFSARDDARACCRARTARVLEAGTEYEISCSAPLAPATFRVASALRGRSGAENCAAVALAALVLGLSPDDVAEGIATARLPEQRFRRVDVGAFRLVDDTYNANPLSMERMLDACAEEAGGKRPLGLVLGEMRELGPLAWRCHEELGLHAARLAPAFVFWTGGEGAAVAAGLSRGGYRGPFVELAGADAFAEAFEAVLTPGLLASGAVLLFKGSRANRLETLLARAVERLGGAREGN